MNLNLLTFRGTPSPSSLLPPLSSSLSQCLDSFYSILLDGCHIQPLNIQLFPCGRKTGQSWVRNGWIVDFCPKWHRPYLARLTTSYYVRTFFGNNMSWTKGFCLQCICSQMLQRSVWWRGWNRSRFGSISWPGRLPLRGWAGEWGELGGDNLQCSADDAEMTGDDNKNGNKMTHCDRWECQ